MNKLVLISLECLLSVVSIHTPAFSQAQKWNEPLEIGHNCTGVSIDSKENLYFTGYSHNASTYKYRFINDTLYIPEYISGAGQYWYYYSFIAKTNKNGIVKWFKDIRGTDEEYPVATITCTEIDGDDNIIIAGKYSSSIIIDTTTILLDESENRSFVAKLDTCGSLVWFNSIKEGSGWDFYMNDLKVDDNNDVYVGGSGHTKLTFYDQYDDVDTIISSNYERMFFAKYSSAGDFNWCESPIEGNNQSEIKGIEVDCNGDIYLTGWWSRGGTFETIEKVSPLSDIFVAKYDSSRELKWLKQFGKYSNTTLELGNDIALDNNLKCIYVTGAFLGEIEIDGTTINAEDENIFLASISTEGNLKWIKKMGSSSGAASYTEQGTNVYVSDDGFVYVGGTIGKNGNFDGTTISAYDDTSNSNLYFDLFVAKYTAAGNLIWVTHAGHPDHDDIINDILKVDNQMYAVGQTRSFAQFDDYNIGGYINYELGFASKLTDISESILQLSKSNLSIDSDTNLIHSFDIICNGNWELSCDENWVTPSINMGIANYQMTLLVDTNYNSIDRESIITITSESGIEEQLKIKQLKNDNDVGIKDVIANTINIYPNPVSDFIFLKTKASFIEMNEISIYDINGHLLHNIKDNVNSKIDISSLKPGIYILSIEGKKFKINKRIIKIP